MLAVASGSKALLKSKGMPSKQHYNSNRHAEQARPTKLNDTISCIWVIKTVTLAIKKGASNEHQVKLTSPNTQKKGQHKINNKISQHFGKSAVQKKKSFRDVSHA